MNELKNKKILLGVCASISAYKSPILVRELMAAGAQVHVVMTKDAERFVSSYTLETLSKNKVIKDMFESYDIKSGSWHIGLARQSDVFMIAPCTANTLAKLANGMADNSLSALALAFPEDKPMIICPAMDTDMYENKITQKNIAIIKDYGKFIIDPEYGELASGLVGLGRLPEPSTLVEKVAFIVANTSPNNNTLQIDNSKSDLYDAGISKIENAKFDAELELERMKSFSSKLFKKKVLVSVGATVEKIDPVRYISNNSSGKMGFAIAKAFNEAGAVVTMIVGKVSEQVPDFGNVIKVQSALEMFDVVKQVSQGMDIIVMAAAVADYRVANISNSKIKKDESEKLNLELEKNPDILKFLGENKEKQFLVGFALETDNDLENAKMKLKNKNCDMIVLNNALEQGAGFEVDSNRVTLLTKTENVSLEQMPKSKLGKEICSFIEARI